MQCRSRRDAFSAAMVDGISEVIDVLILLAWRLVRYYKMSAGRNVQIDHMILVGIE